MGEICPCPQTNKSQPFRCLPCHPVVGDPQKGHSIGGFGTKKSNMPITNSAEVVGTMKLSGSARKGVRFTVAAGVVKTPVFFSAPLPLARE